MAQVTYIAPDKDDRVVDYMGVEFFHDQPKDVDDPRLIAKARTNPHFRVEGDDPVAEPRSEADEAAALEKAKANGAKAAADGKKRRVPPAYAGKPEGDFWLAGYDEAGA